LRETVETGVFFDIQSAPGYIDFLAPDEAESEIQRIFTNSSHPDARILCYTNRKAIRFNDHIRQLRGLPQEYTKGEWVVSNSVCYTAYGTKGGPALRIEEEVEILDVGPIYDFPFHLNGSKHAIQVYDVTTQSGVFRVPRDAKLFKEVLDEIARYCKQNKNWVVYYTLKDNIADLRPRDACTVYKAQGSTYHTVFVDLADIGECRNPAQASRMLYVACSRPTNRICFIGQLPYRFRGL
jgi:hypothetical protein